MAENQNAAATEANTSTGDVCRTRQDNATGFLNRNPVGPGPPHFFFQLEKVASEMPIFRHTSFIRVPLRLFFCKGNLCFDKRGLHPDK
jgi:hypothetical protein